jgi:hypothetical protein
MRPQPFCLLEHEALELLEEHAVVVEEFLHRVRVAEGEMALEEDAVETGDRPGRRSGVLGEELPHGSPLLSEADAQR